jgi:hypothetical protein
MNLRRFRLAASTSLDRRAFVVSDEAGQTLCQVTRTEETFVLATFHWTLNGIDWEVRAPRSADTPVEILRNRQPFASGMKVNLWWLVSPFRFDLVSPTTDVTSLMLTHSFGRCLRRRDRLVDNHGDTVATAVWSAGAIDIVIRRDRLDLLPIALCGLTTHRPSSPGD